MESGNPVPYQSYWTNEEYQPIYDSLVKNASCSNATDTLDCLRQVPFATLNKLINTTYSSSWQPIVDGDFVARWASIQLAEGDFVKVPIIDGANTDEGTAFGPKNVQNVTDFIDDATYSNNEGISRIWAPEILEAYPNVPSYWIPPLSEVPNVTFPAMYGAQYRRSAAYFGDMVRIPVERWLHLR